LSGNTDCALSFDSGILKEKMAKKKKSIDATLIKINNSKIKFEDLLIDLNKAILFNDTDRFVKLVVTKDESNYILGYIQTTKKSGIPPAHDVDKDKYDRLALNKNQGLGYSNSFLYIKKQKVLLYQFEKNGYYLPSLITSLDIKLRDFNSDRNLHLTNHVVLKKEAYERILNFTATKSIELVVSNPRRLKRDYLDENGGLNETFNQGELLNADELTLKYSLKGNNSMGMPIERFKMYLNYLLNLTSNKRSNDLNQIKKVKVEGYLRDPSSDKEFRETIDLFEDKFKSYILIDEPRIKEDPQSKEKCLKLEKLYNKIKDEFNLFNLE
jgi:hypothetical protein